MPTLKSITNHTFGGKKLKRGDKFEATDREAKLVIALGRAKPYQTRVMRPRKEASSGQPPVTPVLAPPSTNPTADQNGDQTGQLADAGSESTGSASIGNDSSGADNSGETDRRDMKADLE